MSSSPTFQDMTDCPSWFRKEVFDSPRNVSVIIILGLINTVVVLGNLLVVLAVFTSSKLRTVTNFLIVSLAVSDLLVGLAVLPYSISLEVLDLWVFGELWCQAWLAVDVWLCTASILNLCAISIDRYLAITRPVHYRAIMTHLRVKLLIATVWVASFIICFPPLVGWNDRVKDDIGEEQLDLGNSTIMGDRLIVLLSEDERSQSDILTTNSSSDQLRFLFRNTTTVRRCPKPQCAIITNQGYVIYSALGSFYIPMLIMLFFYYRIYVVAIRTSKALDRGFRTASSHVTLRMHRGGGPSHPGGGGPSNPGGQSQPGRRSGDALVPRRAPTAPPRIVETTTTGSLRAPESRRDDTELGVVRRTQSSRPSSGNGAAKRNARWHAKRFRTEAKATKTVGIIVGGFILCWLPFFTVYIVVGFCEPCVPPLLFKVFFYLGYCNSALNPVIYGIISKDFRTAFKRILCGCSLSDDGVASLIRHIHMPTFLDESSSCGQT